jgi:hypothetical protein
MRCKEDSPVEEEDKEHNPAPSSFALDVVPEDCVRHWKGRLHRRAAAEGLRHLLRRRRLDLLMALSYYCDDCNYSDEPADGKCSERIAPILL